MDCQQRYFKRQFPIRDERQCGVSWKRLKPIQFSLVDAGYAVHCEAGKIRMSLLRDAVARAACRLPELGNPITAELFERLGELPPERNGGWISEAALFGLANDTDCDSLHELTEIIMPLIVHRCIEVASSTTARFFYRRMVDSLPSVEAPQVSYSEDYSDAYTKAFCQGMELRRSATYSGSQLFNRFRVTKGEVERPARERYLELVKSLASGDKVEVDEINYGIAERELRWMENLSKPTKQQLSALHKHRETIASHSDYVGGLRSEDEQSAIDREKLKPQPDIALGWACSLASQAGRSFLETANG